MLHSFCVEVHSCKDLILLVGSCVKSCNQRDEAVGSLSFKWPKFQVSDANLLIMKQSFLPASSTYSLESLASQVRCPAWLSTQELS